MVPQEFLIRRGNTSIRWSNSGAQLPVNFEPSSHRGTDWLHEAINIILISVNNYVLSGYNDVMSLVSGVE